MIKTGIGVEEDGVKLILKCRHKFWPEKLGGMICADSYIPEIWFRDYGNGVYTVAAFGCGKLKDV